MPTLMPSILTILIVFATSHVDLSATGHRDTVSYYNRFDFSAFYNDPAITAQAARFDLPAPAYLRSVTLWLSGDVGSASVTIYGNEGAFAAPIVGRALTRKIEFSKTKRGVEAVTVRLPDDLFIDRPQYFVVLSDLSTGVRWLSDRNEREPRCSDVGNAWYLQAIQRKDGGWQTGQFAYAIESILEYPESASIGYLADVTSEAEFGPDVTKHRSLNRSISWSDVDDNGLVDLLVGGHLYANQGDDKFRDVSVDASLPQDALSTAHVFLDVDNDRDDDILWFAKEEGRVLLLRNDGRGSFSRSTLSVTSIARPSTLSIADLDGNGYLDVFVGQSFDSAGNVLPSFLLLNDRDGHFTSKPLATLIDRELAFVGNSPIISAQFVDANNDGVVDIALTLAIASDTLVDNSILLLNSDSGRFTGFHESTRNSPAHYSLAVPSDWGDADGDGQPELLEPLFLSGYSVSNGEGRSLSQQPVAQHDLLSGQPYQSFAGAGTWGDVDNNGRLDALITSSCNCRYATLYVQDENGDVHDLSFDYGLFRMPAGDDAVWVDYNEDGLLDLATFVNGYFRLFKNTLHEKNNYVEVDLSGAPNASGITGGRIEAHAEGRVLVRPLYSGRGALMQGPPVIHLGLGNLNRLDSIVIYGVNGENAVVLRDPELNSMVRVYDRTNQTDRRQDIVITTSPNPFSSTLNFTYTLPADQHVVLDLFSIDGSRLEGGIDETQQAGDHRYSWRPVDGTGAPLPAGVYTWRATIGTQTFTGRAVLAK